MKPLAHWLPRSLTATAACVAVWLTSSAAVAAPTYAVHTFTEALDVEAGLFTASGYNTRRIAGYSPLIDAMVGGFTDTNCGTQALGCNPGFSVDPGSSSTATRASSQATMTVIPPPFNTTTADARAYADLAAGKIGVYASGEQRVTGRPIVEGSFGMAFARLSDTLSFQVANADADTHTSIGVRFVIDGLITDNSTGRMNFNFDFGSAQAFGGVSENGQNDFVGGSQNGFWINPSYTILSSDLIQFDARYDLVGSQVDLGLLFQMTAFAGNGATDFGNTGRLQFFLPDGVTYRSGSGVFLTSAVPEPSTLALAALGLLTVSAASRWRHLRTPGPWPCARTPRESATDESRPRKPT
ncbi:MAG: PEP-CTERM sorting domain-containing protein [Burkholderiales bacterium]|nr:PEP-CTERM sorting domain-containing protein [Burkholderiales bacterium]